MKWFFTRFLFHFFLFTSGIFVWVLVFNENVPHEKEYSDYNSFTDITYVEFTSWKEVEAETRQKYQEFLNQNIQKEQDIFSGKKSTISYFPENLSQNSRLKNKISSLQKILDSELFSSYHFDLFIELHQTPYKVRGTFQNKTIKLFWVLDLSDEEFIAVFLHELGHYFDVHYFEKRVLFDLSDRFYNLSWESSRVMKSWLSNSDFVSGYAMTNKFEDFAETFTYYVMYNSEFLEKTQDSEILSEKYYFFQKFLFRNAEFLQTSFSTQEMKSYYWDITKKAFSLEKLLNYFEKWI